MRRLSPRSAVPSVAPGTAAAALDVAPEPIITVDERGRIVAVNQAATMLAGTSAEQLLGRSASDMFGAVPSFEVTTRPLGPDDAAGTVIFLRDVSDRVEWEARFRHQETHHDVTGLPNRFALADHLADLATTDDPRPAALLCVDVDRFKYVNEAHGIPHGDHVLAILADRLVAMAGDDGYTVHIGGDEFAVLVHEPASIELEALAERFRLGVAEPIELNGERLTLQSCVGVAASPRSDQGTEDLLRFADAALSNAKKAGPGTVRRYDAAMTALSARRTKVEQRLRTALATDQLEMFAQPIVDMGDGHIEGVELLARWRHEGEWIPPDVFIPIAEESGLIKALGRWAMGCAVDLLVDLDRAGQDQSVSVNVSGLHLVGGEVAAELRELLDGTEFDRAKLRIEITESFLLSDPQLASAQLDDLRALGVKIVIDDFGTGFSSLTYLHALPIDGIKLDQSFVSRLGHAGADETIVKIVTDLAEGLRLDLVAEGVETDDQRRMLLGHGYRRGQGYLWSRPVPIPQLWPLLHQQAIIAVPLPTPAR